MFYTYVLQSRKDMHLYVGLAKDLKLRFEQHKKGLKETLAECTENCPADDFRREGSGTTILRKRGFLGRTSLLSLKFKAHEFC
jgi:hypothetical protein